MSLKREKQLPPIPRDEPLMAPKSLNRKNIKKLSFNTAAPDHQSLALPRPHLQDVQHPDLRASFESLQLNREAGKPGPLPIAAQRKRQTVISSISPTKSNHGSPSPRTPSYHESQEPFGSLPDAAHASSLPTTPNSVSSLPPSALPSPLHLRDEDLVVLKSLGAGNSGVVVKVLHVPSQRIMAKKTVMVDSASAVQNQILRELRIMHECRSPYIIEFYGAYVRSNNSIVLCMEYCNCGSLDKIVTMCRPKQFPLVVLKKLVFSMLSGLTYLYQAHKIIHRDIKPSNVLMTPRGEFKLCDFGVSRELTNSLAMADTFVGTSMYMSPERIQGLTYGVKSDIWSMGLMLMELASGKSVWSDEEGEKKKSKGPEGILDLLQRIVNEHSPTLKGETNPQTGAEYDPDLCSFIDCCLIKNDKLRKSPQALLEHRFLENVSSGVYDKDVRQWAKAIRKSNKDRAE